MQDLTRMQGVVKSVLEDVASFLMQGLTEHYTQGAGRALARRQARYSADSAANR
jgi:hypothetical protein